MESVIHHIVDTLNNTLGAELIVFLISTLPILELRGGILAASFLKMPVKEAFISITLGVLSAGIIMSLLSYGVLGFFM